MKLFTFVLPFLAAVPLATYALPGARPQPQPQQQPLSLSPANTFSTSNCGLSISAKSTKSSSSLKSLLLPKSSSGQLKCHRHPKTEFPSLSPISDYITVLIRDDREFIFGENSQVTSDPIFDICFAGYDAGDVCPSIYFGALGKTLAAKVAKLLQNKLVERYPHVTFVMSGDKIAVMVGQGEGLRRRNTI